MCVIFCGIIMHNYIGGVIGHQTGKLREHTHDTFHNIILSHRVRR